MELDCSAAGLARRLGVSRASLYRALDALAGRGFSGGRADGCRCFSRTRWNRIRKGRD